MQRALLNRATMRVADTTEVSGRVTADSIKHELYAKTQSSLWRLTIFGFCKVCSLVAATLILPALAYAQNNQGDDQGDGRHGIHPGVPNGTYSFTDNGWVPANPNQHPVVDGQVPLAGAGRETFIPTGTTNGLAFGTTSGVSAFSAGGQLFSPVIFAGTFKVLADGSVSATTTILTPFQETLHFILYPSPDGNTIAFVQTDAGITINGVLTRH
jgi:hypothetical protein